MGNSFGTCSSLWATSLEQEQHNCYSGEQQHKRFGFFWERHLTPEKFQGVKQQLWIFLKCVAQGHRCRQQHAVRGTDAFCDCWNPAVVMMCQRWINVGPILFTNALHFKHVWSSWVLWAVPCLAERHQTLTLTLNCDWSFSLLQTFHCSNTR